MSYQMILQPNNRLSLWCDDKQELLCYDASIEEMAEFVYNQYRVRALCAGKRAAKKSHRGMKVRRTKEYWEEMAKKHKEAALLEAKETFELLSKGVDVYGNRAKSWDSILQHIQETEGDEGLQEFLDGLDKTNP